MARKIVLKDSGLDSAGNSPSGYSYLGKSGSDLSEKVGATVSTVGGSEYTYTEVSVSSAQILNMGTSPIELLATPGASKYYEYHGIVEYSLATITSGNMEILIGDTTRYGGTVLNGYEFQNLAGTNAIFKFGQDGGTYVRTTGLAETTPVNPQLLNAAIEMTTYDSSDPSVCTGTLLIKIWYKIKTFGTEL